MSPRWSKTCLLLTPAFAARGQVECTPEPLPYFEDFNSGFVSNNGWGGQFVYLFLQMASAPRRLR